MSLKKMFSDFDIVYVMVFFIVTVVVFLAYLLSSKNSKRSVVVVRENRRGSAPVYGVPIVAVARGRPAKKATSEREGHHQLSGPITTPSATPPPSVGAFSLMYN